MQTPPTATPAVSQEAREATNSILRIGSLANEALTTAIIHRACVAYADRECAALKDRVAQLEGALRELRSAVCVGRYSAAINGANNALASLSGQSRRV